MPQEVVKKKYFSDGNIAFISFAVLLGSSVLANLIMFYFAAKSYDGLVEKNYYLKGLNYQQELDKQNKQKLLGWNVIFDGSNNKYTLNLTDKDNKPIEKANVKVNFFRPSKEGYDKNAIMKESEVGKYVASTDLELKGRWYANIEITKDGHVWKMKKKITN